MLTEGISLISIISGLICAFLGYIFFFKKNDERLALISSIFGAVSIIFGLTVRLQENPKEIALVGFIFFVCGFNLLTDGFLLENKEKTVRATIKSSKKRWLAIFGIVLGLSLQLVAYYSAL